MPGFDANKPVGPLKIDKNALKNLTSLEDTAIVTAAKAYIEADVHVVPADMNYAVAERTGTFAKVTVGVKDQGGFYAILKKVYETWVVVVTGQDKPGKDIGSKYGLPTGWFSTEY